MITWATKNKRLFQGDNDRPITELEKFAVYALAGATILICLVRLYQHTIIWF